MGFLKPNVIFVVADNLGWGELGCYGGGSLRGAPTPEIDALASQGLLLQNFNVESDCVPTRSAFMTGRHPIRTGCLQSVPAGLPQGLTRREVTLAQLMKQQGYATAHFGKWHLGDTPGRFPSDRGFDVWYGIPRTSNESMFTGAIGFDPTVVDVPQVMEGNAQEGSRKIKAYDLEQRRLLDGQLVERATDFIRAQHRAGKPFFLYLPLINLHWPMLPHPEFARRSRYGEFADCVLEMDHRVGQVVAEIDRLGLSEESVFIFCSDNGPEFRHPWRGTAGPWSGTYHTAMEGSLRVPFILRWPGRVRTGQVSNEMVHAVDIFTTLACIAGARIPDDRPIDGLNMLPFFTGKSERAPREGFLFYLKEELYAVKWRDWKLHLRWQPAVNDMKGKLESPFLFNIVRDPKEEISVLAENSWVMGPIRKMVLDFEQSFRRYPNTPPGAPDGA